MELTDTWIFALAVCCKKDSKFSAVVSTNTSPFMKQPSSHTTLHLRISVLKKVEGLLKSNLQEMKVTNYCSPSLKLRQEYLKKKTYPFHTKFYDEQAIERLSRINTNKSMIKL